MSDVMEMDIGEPNIVDERKSVDDQQKDFAEREKNLAMRENKLEAEAMLESRGMSKALTRFILDEDSDVQAGKLNDLKKIWDEEMKSAIKARVAGSAPPLAVEMPSKPFSEMSYQERFDLKKKNPDAYKRLSGK